MMEVSSSNKEFNKEEDFVINESNILKDIPKYNENETHNRKDEENIEENLQDCDAMSPKNNCYKELENNETSTTRLAISVNNSYPDNGIDLDKSENSNELKDSEKSYNEDNNTEQLLSKRFLDLVDSDSEDEITSYKTLKKSTNDKCDFESSERLETANYKKNLENKRRIIDSESEDDTQISKINNSQTVHKTINSFQSSNSESEEEKEKTQDSVIAFEKVQDISENKNSKKESVKKRKGSIRASKNEAMHQIYSETQRLLRETEVSLPYHRPKQRTLQEFLNRKKILTSLPKASSTATKLKMSSTIVNQVLAEKEREAELFYKSSDSEDDMQPTSFAARNIKKSSTMQKKMPLIGDNNTCIQDFQKIDTSNKAFHNETEIVQDDVSLDTSIVPETDFSKVDNQNKESSLLPENSSIHDDVFNTLSQQTDYVYKQNQKLGVSRKLFDTCFENETNKDSDISLEKQETTEGTVETTITSLEKKEIINDKKKSEFNMAENHISEILQCDSEAINIDRDKNLTEQTIIKEISNINDKERNVTSINSNIIIENDEDNEKKDKCDETDIASSSTITNFIDDVLSKIRNNPSTEECKDSDSRALDLPFSKFVDESLIDRKKLLPKLTSNFTVTLKGSPGMIIDLTNNEKSYGKDVNTLLDRFFCKHVVNAKRQTNDKAEETEAHLQDTLNNSSPIKESLPYNLPANTDNPELNKPGAKLMRLKEDLKLHMTIKRNKEWRHKEIELREKEEKEKEELDEEEECDYDSDGQERDLDSELSDSGESEPEENDIYIKDKKRSKCLFADDEAEVTDNEDSGTDTEKICSKNDIIQTKCNNKQITNFKCRIDDSASEIETDQNEEEEEVIDSDKEDIENGSVSDSKDDDNINVCKNFGKKDKEKKQSLQESQDDLNVINPSCSETDNNQLKNITILDVNTSETWYKNKDGLTNEDKSDIPAHQQHPEVVARSQIYKTPLTKKSMLDFVSPITQLSVLNTTLDSNNKDILEKKGYPIDIDEKSVFAENTQSDGSSEYAYNNRNKNISKKKLFDDNKETVDDEYLMRLCSGKFESTQRTDLDLFSSQTNSELCPENTVNTKLIEQLENHEEENENSQDVRLILDEDSNSANHVGKEKQVGASKLKMKIVSSDDDDDQLDETDTGFLKPRKRSGKRLHLSDSEEEDAQSSDDEENEDDVDDDDKKAEEQYVDYDSEENEMIIVPEKDIKKVAADFLDKEAELSESDWDSADEDEKDLDKLEYEEGDDEHMDEHEMKNQLENIHRRYMKEMLDEDKREVRLIQELLFEDGDLHVDGMGRERKFKWKNIDKLGGNTEISRTPENDGWLDVQEDEEEAKWSKLRQERDKFLEERMKKSSNNEIEDELCDSQIFKFGLEALKKIKNNNECRDQSSASYDKVDSSENMEPIMPRNITDLLNGPNTEKKSQTIYNVIKKRSLLTRGEESLAKIASLAKQGDSVSHTINARNFVFQYINENNTSMKDDKTKEEDQDSQTKPRKRKVMSNFSSTTKKRRK